MVSPEGATPGRGHHQARDLEQTIAGNVAEIREAGAAVGGGVGLVRGQGLRRVPPFQGGEDLLGAGSQGVALGYRVIAPLARNTGAMRARNTAMRVRNTAIRARNTETRARGNVCANGAKPVSPGQRPGNSATHKLICPERATPGHVRAPARDLEQTIAGNVAEILEA